ncbi:MAG: cell division protein FtsQ/DivIB [Sporichthyaceae bacterium]
MRGRGSVGTGSIGTGSVRTAGGASTPGAAAAAAERFAARIKARRRSRWVKAGLGLGALALVAVGVWVICFSALFSVRSVQIAGTDRLAAAQVAKAAAVPRGGSLALLDTAGIAARVRALAPVAEVSVARRFPSTVRIEITERIPVAVLDARAGRRLVDAAGVAFAPAGAKATDRLTLVATTREGLAPGELVQVAQMLKALPARLRPAVRRVEVDSIEDMTIALRDGRRIVWGGPTQSAFKAQVLSILLADRATRRSRVFDVSVPEAPATRR